MIVGTYVEYILWNVHVVITYSTGKMDIFAQSLPIELKAVKFFIMGKCGNLQLITPNCLLCEVRPTKYIYNFTQGLLGHISM